MIVNFNVIELIVINEPLLARVEDFLRREGQDHLADMLNKLQQDSGLKYFNEIGNGLEANEEASAGIGRHENFVGGEVLDGTTPLLDGYEEIPPQRLQVLDVIREELRGKDGTLEADYAGLMRRLEWLAEPAPGITALQPPRRDFSF